MSDFVPKIKDLGSLELKSASFQMVNNLADIKYYHKYIFFYLELFFVVLIKLSNLCAHKSISEKLLDSNQEVIFKDLSEFALIEAHSDAEKSLHEASISFFFNLVSAYHLESKVWTHLFIYFSI